MRRRSFASKGRFGDSYASTFRKPRTTTEWMDELIISPLTYVELSPAFLGDEAQSARHAPWPARAHNRKEFQLACANPIS